MDLKALWEPTNKSNTSSVFTVPVGKVCVLYAVGLEQDKVRQTADEFLAPQALCVRKIIAEHLPVEDIDACHWVVDMTRFFATHTIVDSFVQSNGCSWSLDACSNMRIIGVPGTYCLELNDTTAIGKVQVYAELYDINHIPMQVRDLFFS